MGAIALVLASCEYLTRSRRHQGAGQGVDHHGQGDLRRARLVVKTCAGTSGRQLPRRGKGEAVSFLRRHIESRHSVDTAYFLPHLLLADPC